MVEVGEDGGGDAVAHGVDVPPGAVAEVEGLDLSLCYRRNCCVLRQWMDRCHRGPRQMSAVLG